MFARFVERGLALPASDFFKGLLKYYGIEYLNLNPNGISQVSVFVHFCEALVGIKPHWILFRKFFRLKPQPSANDPRVVGGAGIQMREDAVDQYLSYKLLTVQNCAQVHSKPTGDLVPFSPRRVLPRFVNPRIGSKLLGFSI
jgi:hypothetical protein